MTALLDRPAPYASPDRPPRGQVWVVVALIVLSGLGLVWVLARAGGAGSDDSSGTPSSAASSGAASSEAAVAPPDLAAGPAAQVAVVEGDAVVREGQVALVARQGQVPQVLGAVQRAAEARGGRVDASSVDTTDGSPFGRLVLRVPTARFDDLVLAVRDVGAQVRTASSSAKDVTGQTADLGAQVTSLTASRERFLAILGRAQTVPEVLSVQQQVDDVTSRIDRLQAQLTVLRARTEQATLEVQVAERGGDLPGEDRDGWGGALQDAGSAFTGGLQALLRGSGAALLVVLVLGVGLLVGRVAVRVGRRLLP
jgi:hypothetical protein